MVIVTPLVFFFSFHSASFVWKHCLQQEQKLYVVATAVIIFQLDHLRIKMTPWFETFGLVFTNISACSAFSMALKLDKVRPMGDKLCVTKLTKRPPP